MTTFKDMPLDTTLQVGDIVTITGPGEHDVLVREVTGVNEHTGPFVSDMASTTIRLAHLISGLTRTLTRIQRPVPALPTVDGDYILTYADGARQVRTLTDGRWTSGRGLLVAMKADIQGPIESGATLTRVIPADEAKHPEVDVVKAGEAFADANKSSFDEDFVATLCRVLAGEFDL